MPTFEVLSALWASGHTTGLAGQSAPMYIFFFFLEIVLALLYTSRAVYIHVPLVSISDVLLFSLVSIKVVGRPYLMNGKQTCSDNLLTRIEVLFLRFNRSYQLLHWALADEANVYLIV